MSARPRCSWPLAVVLVACTSSAPPAAVPPIASSTPSPPTTASVPPPSSASASTSAASSNGAPPPSGLYHYTMHVVSDDCTPATQPIEEKGMMVFAHATAKGLLLNVPMIVQPTSTGGVVTIARTDLEATPGIT